MSNEHPYLLWMGIDQRLVVKEMIRDQNSRHWEECNNFVKHRVYARATNIPSDLQEDIIQEVMYKVTKYLPHFRFKCALKTWLNLIIERCIIDEYRSLQNKRRYHTPLADLPIENDHEGEELYASDVKSVEDNFITDDFVTLDKIHDGLMALIEYINNHSNPIRNRFIIWMVIIDGQTYAETAVAAGCHVAVVGHVVREAQRYARERMK